MRFWTQSKYCHGLLAALKVSVVLLSMSARAADEGVVLKGSYEYSSYLHRTTPRLLAKWDFTVSLNGCFWLIDCSDLKPVSTKTDLRIVTACDGTNIYVVHYPNNLAEVYRGVYPSGKDIRLQYLWIAFASRCVLPPPEGDAKPPWPADWGIFGRDDYVAHYQWLYGDGHIPCALVFLNNGTFFSRNPASGALVHQRYAPPYSNGFTHMIARWSSVTNVMGVPLPEDFKMTMYSAASKAASSNDLEKVATFSTLLTNIAVSAIPPIPPELPDQVFVTDRRFTDQGYAYVMYYETNRIWPAKDDPAVQQVVEHAPRFSEDQEALAGLGIRQMGDAAVHGFTNGRQEQMRLIVLLTFSIPPLALVIFLIVKYNAARSGRAKA